MMFRSLLVVSPLISWADEQTAMLQLNRRGQLSESAANDLLVSSMEKSLLSKDDDKKTTNSTKKDKYIQIHKLAKCRYHLKSKHPIIPPKKEVLLATAPKEEKKSSALLEQMYASKGKDKTHELIQRAVAAVGEDNFRTFEENLVGKDEEKNVTKAIEYKESTMTACEILDQLKYAFETNLNDVKTIKSNIAGIRFEVDEDILKKATAAFEAGKAKVATRSATVTVADVEIVKEMLPFKLDHDEFKKIIEKGVKEKDQVTQAIRPMLEKIKGSEMHDKVETALNDLITAVTALETGVGDTIREEMRGITGHNDEHKVPAVFDPNLFTLPKAPEDASWTDEHQKIILDAIVTGVKAADGGTLLENAYLGIGLAQPATSDFSIGLKDLLTRMVSYHYTKHEAEVWGAMRKFWRKVLNTPSEPAEDFRVKDMKTPPGCTRTYPHPSCQLDHDLFWEQASAYLEVADPSNADRREYEVETECMAEGYDRTKPLQFEPRQICEGRHGHHVQLECIDEFVYLAKKHGNTTLEESCKSVGKMMFFDSDKLRDEDKPHVQECFEQGKKKGTDCTKFQFMQYNDGETCRTVEDLKHACRIFEGKAKVKDDKQVNRMAH